MVFFILCVCLEIWNGDDGRKVATIFLVEGGGSKDIREEELQWTVFGSKGGNGGFFVVICRGGESSAMKSLDVPCEEL